MPAPASVQVAQRRPKKHVASPAESRSEKSKRFIPASFKLIIPSLRHWNSTSRVGDWIRTFRNKHCTFTLKDADVLERSSWNVLATSSTVAYRQGGFGVFNPPEIPKFFLERTVYIVDGSVPRGGAWSVQTPPKFRSFDKAEPNSQFRGKYIRNNP
jgi:hypothetical protein